MNLPGKRNETGGRRDKDEGRYCTTYTCLGQIQWPDANKYGWRDQEAKRHEVAIWAQPLFSMVHAFIVDTTRSREEQSELE